MDRVVAVACSGGRDSLALLHAAVVAASEAGVSVVALHVHHGLHPQADVWADHVQSFCDDWAQKGLAVRCLTRRIADSPKRGDSVEAWAREVRYAALNAMATEAGASLLLLGHHRRDQAETVLLQALRGAGPAGLSAMPAAALKGGIRWVRPWLNWPRSAIEAYVRAHGLLHVEDGSNADPRFVRNRLRQQVWPVLLHAFPDAEVALANAARCAHDAQAVLDEVASLDLSSCQSGVSFNLCAWERLSRARRGNVLRAWLAHMTGAAPPASLSDRLQEELLAAGPATWPAPGGQLRKYRGFLRYEVTEVVPAALPAENSLSIRRAGRYRLPGWGGELLATRVKEGGVPLAWLAHLELRARQGGEQFQAGLGRPPRSLKKQFQARAIPEWERVGPLVYSGGQLVFVPGLGVDARAIGFPGQPQLALEWRRT